MIDGLVTGPINKNNIQNSDFGFKGHTDFLDTYFNGDALMCLIDLENNGPATIIVGIAMITP